MESFKEPVEGNMYVSPSLIAFQNAESKVRIVSKITESLESYAFGTIKDEIVLRLARGSTKIIKAKFFEDNRQILVLSIQGYNPATDKPHNASFSFIGDEITKLYDFLKSIQIMQLDNSHAMRISDEDLEKFILSKEQIERLVSKDPRPFIEMIKTEVTTEDIIAIGYRKKQLEVFKQLLDDVNYFEKLRAKKRCNVESLWQQYFEKNSWIFGYGLGYVFLTGLDEKKLEQVVQGYNVGNYGKRVDALMKTKGLISSLCFVEIKTHNTPLLNRTPYRPGCWAVSSELSGAVAQVQGTVASAVVSLSDKIAIKDNLGDPTGEEIFNYQPRSYLVIGDLDEFRTEVGVNEEKLRSFELFRKSINNMEIITFDELFERAKFIVQHNEQ